MRLAELVSLPTIINGFGYYRTRCGETVVIDDVSVGRLHPTGFFSRWDFAEWALGYYPNGVRESWDVSGRLLPFSLSENDIVSKLT